MFGILSDRKGRKKMYGVELIIIVIGTVGSALSGNLVSGFSVFTVLGLWRFVILKFFLDFAFKPIKTKLF